jgi:hypothetical protein
MRYILRFAFLAVLFAFATSAHAQDCSTAYHTAPSGTQVPPDPRCSGRSEEKFPRSVRKTTLVIGVANHATATTAYFRCLLLDQRMQESRRQAKFLSALPRPPAGPLASEAPTDERVGNRQAPPTHRATLDSTNLKSIWTVTELRTLDAIANRNG